MSDKLSRNYVVSGIFTGKFPVQERSQQRMALVLETAETLLELVGHEETSIPEIAKMSGVPRASIYQFFPNKYALFAHITQQHVLNLVKEMNQVGREQINAQNYRWSDHISLMLRVIADYCNTHSVASMLIFGGPFSRSTYLKFNLILADIGHQFRKNITRASLNLTLPEQPDIITLSVEIGFACMKHGYYLDGSISAEICEEANRAVTAYLSNWIPVEG